MSSSDFCVCANEASPGATVLKNALVKNGAFFFSFLDFGTGMLVFTVFFFEEGGDLVTCGAAEDLVVSGAVEVDGSCLIGDRVRGGSFALLSSSSSNAVLQKRPLIQWFPNLCPSSVSDVTCFIQSKGSIFLFG